MKLWGHKSSKLTKPNFFGKFSIAPKWVKNAQNDPNCLFVCYYGIFLRIGSLVFFIFCMKLRDHNYLKLMEPNFCGKFLLPGKLAERPKMAQFIHLSITTPFFSGLAHIFLYIYFAWSLGTISTENWWTQVNWENFCLPERRPKGPTCPLVCL